MILTGRVAWQQRSALQREFPGCAELSAAIIAMNVFIRVYCRFVETTVLMPPGAAA